MMEMITPSIQITEADLLELMRINPLAAEQMKNLALQRRIRQLEKDLAVALSLGGISEKASIPTPVNADGRQGNV